MLPSLRNEARIALAPDRVSMTLVARGWRTRVVGKHCVPCSAKDAADWRPAVAALERGLSETGWRNADAVAILSNHFVRYVLVPWSEHLASDEEKRAWVRHHFADLYGEAAADGDYRWSEDRPDALCLASAVAPDLIGGIRAAFGTASLALKSIQPYLMAVFNRWRPRIKGDAVWILVPESGRLCLASVAGGRWRSVKCKSIGADVRADMRVVLERELLLADEPAPPQAIFAYAPGIAAFELPDGIDVPVTSLAPRTLPGFAPDTDAEYAMALTGVA